MIDFEPPTTTGKVYWGFTMSLDGFVAGPNHDMGWMTGFTSPPGLIDEYIETTGAVQAGRAGFDSAIGDSRPRGGTWRGPIFVLTHHPEDARPAPDVTVLSCPVAEAVRIGLEAARGKHLAVFSPTIGAQLLELGLIDEIDEIDISIAPVLLGNGIQLYHNPGKAPIRLHRLDESNPTATARVRYRPVMSR